MNVKNIDDASAWFEVLQTSAQAQTAVMTLQPGAASGPGLNTHEKSEQVLIVLKGEVEADIAGEKRSLGKGDVVIVPAGVPHRFANKREQVAITMSVYAPPEYPGGEKG